MVNVEISKRLRTAPHFQMERKEGRLRKGAIAGVDEAGRGPWAGPVVAAAVVLTPGSIPAGIDDSKALDALSRERLYERIIATSRVGVGIGDVARIDRDNILQATFFAMTTAVGALEGPAPVFVLVDGNQLPRLEIEARAIVDGDAICLSIAAASIVAKVTRDRIMTALALEFPGYGFEQHKGYGTARHREALAALGPTPHHRRSFKPIRLALGLEAACDVVSAIGCSVTVAP